MHIYYKLQTNVEFKNIILSRSKTFVGHYTTKKYDYKTPFDVSKERKLNLLRQINCNKIKLCLLMLKYTTKLSKYVQIEFNDEFTRE